MAHVERGEIPGLHIARRTFTCFAPSSHAHIATKSASAEGGRQEVLLLLFFLFFLIIITIIITIVIMIVSTIIITIRDPGLLLNRHEWQRHRHAEFREEAL